MKIPHIIVENLPKKAFFRYNSLTGLLLLATTPALADDYFDPSF